MTSNDAKLTFDEDAELYKLGRVIATRTKREEAEERKNTQKSRIPRRLVKTKEKFSVQGVQTRLKRNDRFEISDRVVN